MEKGTDSPLIAQWLSRLALGWAGEGVERMKETTRKNWLALWGGQRNF